ncbi:hypothetical protein [Bathymodiolus japonicus methanotrophic gill symbiont]|uniref:hypothetical protein n=1 Tax=Bathymodiolus japonicus methanotrophic gill symbiont TaxID=113269 RepID=UPI001E3B3A54|nr:hypothetical protein [Bathymodiolus japonicus methanotrophic gill symbiont]
MGDALNALRPQRLRTKAASSLLPHWLDGYSECNSCSSRVLLAHVESENCPVACFILACAIFSAAMRLA